MTKSNLRIDTTFWPSRHPGPWALALLLTLSLRCEAQLSWTTRQLDFQPAVTDEAVQGDFEFVNAGASPVTVTDVKTSCGCTTAALAKKTYAPGEKGKIAAIFHIGDRMGLQQKQIMVTMDNAEEPYAQLTIRAFIPELLRIEPRAVVWPQNSEPSMRTLRVTTGTEQAVKILGVRASDDRMFAQLKQIEPGRSYEINVSVNSTLDPIRGTLRVDTDYPPGRPKVFNIPLEVSAPFAPPPATTQAIPAAPSPGAGRPAVAAAARSAKAPAPASNAFPPPSPGKVASQGGRPGAFPSPGGTAPTGGFPPAASAAQPAPIASAPPVPPRPVSPARAKRPGPAAAGPAPGTASPQPPPPPPGFAPAPFPAQPANASAPIRQSATDPGERPSAD